MTVLSPAERAFLDATRTATLATIDPDGCPRLVPICFVVSDEGGAPVLWSPIDEKPKRSAEPRSLARVRDVLYRADVTLLVDHWSEAWSELHWLRIRGQATLVEPDPEDERLPAIVAALRTKYPQYNGHDLERRPMLQIAVESIVGWSASG
ncbi:MAG: pyridoxamine 5'-phosphate oxidase family protein [Candidatus Limnocylindrales bacterium]